MKIVKQYEEDGYNIIEYDNGFREKTLISSHIDIENEEIDKNIPTQQEIINAQIINELEYLKCLTELNSMKGGNL
ncbi:MAG: hypothetical protein ACLUCH_06875 [Lachnospirales bacterium]